MMLSYSLIDFPEEILIIIAAHLDVTSLLRLKETCKILGDIVERSSIIRYRIELYEHGMTDGAPDLGMVAEERLSCLRQYANSWGSFTPYTFQRIRTFPADFYNECGGVYGECSAFNPRVFTTSLPQTLTFQSIPTRRRDCPDLKSWTLTNLPYNIDDFNLDPSQDLLITLHYPRGSDNWRIVKLRILSLRSGKKHPLAKEETIENDLTSYPFNHAIQNEVIHEGWTLKICHNWVCTFHRYIVEDMYEERLTMWDWPTGARVLTLIGGGISSCSFFSPDYLLLALVGGGVHRPQHGDDQARIAICDIKHTAKIQKDSPNAFVNVCELQLPPLKVDNEVQFIYIRTNTHAKDQAGAAFKLSPQSRLFAIHMLVNRRHHGFISGARTYRFLVPFTIIESHMKETISHFPFDVVVLKYPNAVVDPAPSSPVPEISEARRISVPWSCWIPNGTRLFHHRGDITRLERNRFFLVYGLRFLPPPISSRRSIDLFDFNLRPILKKRVCNENTEGGAKASNNIPPSILEGLSSTPFATDVDDVVIRTPDVLPDDDDSAFSEEITTSLPYRLITVHFNRMIRDAFLTEDSIFLNLGHPGELTAVCF